MRSLQDPAFRDVALTVAPASHTGSLPQLSLIADGDRVVGRLQHLVARLTSTTTTGMWRLAADGKHIADVVIAAGNICYVVLHGPVAPTLGELLARRHPERATEIRAVLGAARERGQRLGETLAIVDGYDAAMIRDCLREQIAERLALLARVNRHIEGQLVPLNGAFDMGLTFCGEEAYAAARDRLDTLNGRVLFVDDDPNILRAITRVASGWPLVVDCAPSAKAAEAMAQRAAYDVVVVDYVLDDGNGAELSATIRQTQPNATFALASGMLDEDALRQVAVSHGIDDVLPKPFNARLLQDFLTRGAL